MKYLVLGLGSLCLASTANAKDFPGLRFEANIGWDKVNATAEYEDTAFPEDNFKETENTDGFFIGAGIGYDVPVGPVYLGVEGTFDIPINKRCEPIYGDDAGCFKAQSNYAVGGRIGVPAGKSALVYVGAAYVNAEAKVSYSDDLDPSYDFSYTERRGGYRVSGGAEIKLVDNWYTKLEYRYSDYKDYDYTIDTETYSLGFDRHQVLTGIGARF